MEVELLGVKITVDYDIEPYDCGNYETPPSGGEVTINDVLINNASIYNLLSDKQFDEITQLIIKENGTEKNNG